MKKVKQLLPMEGLKSATGSPLEYSSTMFSATAFVYAYVFGKSPSRLE